MLNSWKALYMAALCLLASNALADETPTPIRVRLVSARVSERRGRNLEVQFERVDNKEKLVRRFPAHSFTPHEATLIRIIRSCVELNKGESPQDWSLSTRAEAVFMIPPEPHGNSFEKWRLVELRPGKPKQTPR